jgi:iron complex outermembrane receptor protein
MVYTGYVSGFKSGDLIAGTSVDPEIVDTWSLGVKSMLLDGAMRLNGEIFYNDYQDKQLRTTLIDENAALIQTLDNVGKMESTGVEAEMTWLLPVEGLAVDINVGYLDYDVNQYLNAVEDPATGEAMVVNVADTTALGFSPEWTGQARVSYSFDTGNSGSMYLSADVAYRDEMYTDSPIDLTVPIKENALSDSLTTYNAVVAWTTQDQHWRVALEGKNLTDERELVNSYNAVPFFLNGGYNRERTWALSVAYTY